MCEANNERLYSLLDIDTLEWGCPKCGGQVINEPITSIEQSYIVCSTCGQAFKIVSASLTIKKGKTRAFSTTDEHPRKNTSTKKPNIIITHICDITYIKEGYSTGCFICGGPKGIYQTFSFCVYYQGAGEKILSDNPKGVWFSLGSRQNPQYHIVIGSCNKHTNHLVKLLFLLQQGVFTQELIDKSKE